jgi:hypothetical protein
MSGGAFDHKCFQISQFAEELKNRIDENDKENDEGYAPHYGADTIKTLKACQVIIELSGVLAWDIEWLYNGDHSEELFNKRNNVR